jgi:mRNA interferase RelE/StbE
LVWQVNFADQARHDLKRLDPSTSQQILRYLRERIATNEDPKRFGKALTGTLVGLWRYHIGDYRVVCRIDQQTETILVLTTAHRSKVYQ